MKKLLIFEFLRLKNNKILFILPSLLILIGISGILLSSVYFGTQSNYKLVCFNIYNAYAQFTFLFVSYIYIYYFSEDFKKGIYSFYRQIGYSLRSCLFTKFLLLVLISILFVDLFFLFIICFFKAQDASYVALLISSVDVSIIFCITFSLFLSVLFKKTLIAVAVNFAIYILSNVLNLILFGLANPSDGNSLNTTTIKYLSTGELSHKSLSTVNWDFDSMKIIFSLGTPIVYSLILLLIIYIWTKKERVQ